MIPSSSETRQGQSMFKWLCYFNKLTVGGCVVLGLHWPLGFCRVVVVLLG